MCLARLWRKLGKRQQAHDLLGPICNWFTGGFDTVDLKTAKTFLMRCHDEIVTGRIWPKAPVQENCLNGGFTP
jgi:hypothetical protein